MHSTLTKAALAALIVSSITTGFAQQTEPLKVKLDTSYVFTRGDYGLAEDTDVSVLLVNPSIETSGWRLQGSIPYVFLSGPASIVGNTGTTLVSRSERGMGDLSLAGTRKLEIEGTGWSNELTLKFKFPTADENKGLGTGKTDTILQMDAYRSGGKITPYGTLGYQFLGRSTNYPMKDGLFATAGVAGQASPATTIGLAANWRQAVFDGGDSSFEGMAFFQRKFSDQSRLWVFVLHGFTDASPNIAIGATLGFSY